MAVGEGSMVGLYDVRARNPSVLLISGYSSDICGLSWSVNQSSDLMRKSSPDEVCLAAGDIDGTLGIWTLNEIIRSGGKNSILDPSSSLFWAEKIQRAPMQSMAWHPKQNKVLATGGGDAD